MFSFDPVKFGRDSDARASGDTPVSKLSKIFSKTSSVDEHSDQSHMGTSKLASITEGIPFDLDESANQEAPDCNQWLKHNPSLQHLNSDTLLNCEVSNGSSGYCSCTTQSAPPTCDSFHSDLTDTGLFVHRRFSEHKTVESDSNSCSEASHLRRSQSCRNRGWLIKRHRKQAWPRISGIRKMGSFSPRVVDSNSCPPILSNANLNLHASLTRFSLPPVGENGSSPDGSPSHGELFPTFASPENLLVRRSLDVSMNSSTIPLTKRPRIESPMKSNLYSEEADVDVTLPLEAVEGGNETTKNDENLDARPEIPFEILRHHSTPVLAARPAVRYCNEPSPPYCSEMPSDTRPVVRCASVPAQSISEKLSRCISVLDNPHFRCDGRRPRALPVVHRMDSGLHCVSIDTVAELISNPTERRNINYLIIDCRFPYEYDGGHIQGAHNIFTHSDLVQEIFNRVPAQRPPGISGPPKLLGEHLTRRLAMPLKEPLSAPCEPVSDEDEDEEYDEDKHQFTSEASQLELAAANNSRNSRSDENDSVGERQRVPSGNASDNDLSSLSLGGSSASSLSNEPAFVVIFHCEFSSQRAPDLAAFLRSIDRISNYQRYPFLYFPEIYVMKGGYSAFYQNYPNLCTPNAYVKMSHRDYRPHYRLYRRLTKRVSSACTACIRPQHKLFNPPMVDALNSFAHLSGVQNSHSLQELPESKCSSPPLEEDLHSSGDEKENKVVAFSMDSTKNSPASTSRSSSRRSSLASEPDSVDESPLQLAETIVRVGQRVIAATLSTADLSLGIEPLLAKFHEQVASVTARAEDPTSRVSLKRSETVGTMFNLARRRSRHRNMQQTPLCNLLNNPLCIDEGSDGTPAAPTNRKRVILTPLNRLQSAPLGDALPTTPPYGGELNDHSSDFERKRLSHSLSFSP